MTGCNDGIGIPCIPTLSDRKLEEVASILDLLDAVPMAYHPWPAYKADVNVRFAMAHSEDVLFLKYYVCEEQLIAKAQINGNIHEDSCVECFLAFADDVNYYNLEFNCLGIGKIGYGPDRVERQLLEEIKLVEFLSVIRSAAPDHVSWELLLRIPVAVFQPVQNFKGLQAKGNFYKCGDSLSNPHYMSWQMIHAKEPDFHCPASFGNLYFQI